MTAWRRDLEALDVFVGDFTICQYGKPGQWLAIDMVAVIRFPDSLKTLPLEEIEQRIFLFRKPVKVSSMASRDKGRNVITGAVYDMVKGEHLGSFARFELTNDWVRFYLKAPITCATSKEALQGQEPVGSPMLLRIAKRVRKLKDRAPAPASLGKGVA